MRTKVLPIVREDAHHNQELRLWVLSLWDVLPAASGAQETEQKKNREYWVGQEEVCNCEYTKQIILILLFIFHTNNCKPTSAPPCM